MLNAVIRLALRYRMKCIPKMKCWLIILRRRGPYRSCGSRVYLRRSSPFVPFGEVR